MSAAALTAQVQHHNQKGAFDICCSGRSAPCECSLLLSCRVWSSDGWTCCWREKCKGAKPISAPIFLCVSPLHSSVFLLYFPQCFSPAFAFLNERQKNNKTLGFSFVFELQKGGVKGDRGLRETGKWNRIQEEKWMFLSSEERICQYSDLANILWNYNKRGRCEKCLPWDSAEALHECTSHSQNLVFIKMCEMRKWQRNTTLKWLYHIPKIYFSFL